MAATSFDVATAATDLDFDFFIYDEERQSRQSLQQQQQHQPQQQHTQFHTQPQPLQPPSLPTGRCNYVDLTHGSGAAQCGCRRFWSRTPSTPYAAAPTVHHELGLLTSSAIPPSDPGYCMCSHHACFHDHDHDQAPTQAPTSVNTSFFNITPAPAVDGTLGQENEKPRAALSPVQLGQPLQLLQQAQQAQQLQQLQQLEQLEHLGGEQQQREELLPQQAEESIPDTLSWGGLQLDLPSQLTANSLLLNSSIPCPPPSQPSQPSQKASSTTSSRYMRPFAGRGLDTLPEGRPAETALSTVSTVSAALAPAGKALSVAGSTTSTSSTAAPVSQALRAHDARLERLENPSFFASTSSQALFTLKEDVLERHDQVDLRVTELESRMEDVERRIADEGGSIREAVSSASASTSAFVSAVSLATPRPASPDNTNLLHQLHTLQQEVALLRHEASLLSAAASSGPSSHNPWLLEIVFMPFPLKGLWVEASQFANAAAVAAASAAKRRQELFARDHLFSAPDEWTLDADERSDVPRLLPRACAPGRLIDRRLRSRGLVQTVAVKGGDARAVEAAVAEAFCLASSWTPKAADSTATLPATLPATTTLGLQHPWVPLRKVHKDSRLRFLTRAEMATPALWTPAFLKESVVMKVGQAAESEDKKHRLYITQPGAYTQGRQAHADGWSWGRLRGAEAVGKDSSDESVWEWNSRLDEAPVDTQSSASTDTTEEVEVAEAAEAADKAPADDALVGDILEAAPAPAIPFSADHASAHVSRSPTSSQFFTVNQSPVRPISTALTSSRSASSHRLSSVRRSMSPFFVSAVQSSGMQSRSARPPPIRTPSARTSVSVSRVSKRRSPSIGAVANFWPRNTPRYSRSPSAAPLSARVRGTTPFCYATPYSNAYGDDGHDGRGQEEENAVHRRRTYPGYGFNGGFGVVDDAMDMMGYGSDDYDEVDFDDGEVDEEDVPMTQDGDDIQVYEDRDDAHLLSDLSGKKEDEQEKPVLPEDEPWPGIDSNYEGDSGGYDGSNSVQSSASDGSHAVDEDDEDDEMSDENANPGLDEFRQLSRLSQLSQFSQLSQQQHRRHHTEPTEPADPMEPAEAVHFPVQHHSPPHAGSDSSQPSEYPSTRRPRKRPSQPQPHQLLNEARQFGMYGFDEGGMGFTIHEDEA